MGTRVEYITFSLLDYCVKSIRLIARSGQANFHRFVYEPLEYAGWESKHSKETSKNMIRRIDLYEEQGNAHTIGPLCKRLISRGLSESLKDLGDACLFFLEKMRYNPPVLRSREALDFVNILLPHFKRFDELNLARSANLFEKKLESVSDEEIVRAYRPLELGKYKIKVRLRQAAYDLFRRIKIAHQLNDYSRCQKLISAYLIKFGDTPDNNREQVDELIKALTKREPDFKTELMDSIAITLYFEILNGITGNDLRQTIQGIRKYFFIFQGDENTRHFMEIDSLEKKLYSIMDKKNLWETLRAEREKEKSATEKKAGPGFTKAAGKVG